MYLVLSSWLMDRSCCLLGAPYCTAWHHRLPIVAINQACTVSYECVGNLSGVRVITEVDVKRKSLRSVASSGLRKFLTNLFTRLIKK